MRVFDKSVCVLGRNIYLRAAIPSDADFVYGLRTNAEKNKFLNKIGGTINDQRVWLKSSCSDPYQIYFVICSNSDERIGLVRIYDQQDDSFCWGSWLIKDGAPLTAAMESALLIYKYAVQTIGFTQCHFDVRIGNEKVISFHKKFGAIEVDRSESDIFFELSGEKIREALLKYKKYL